MLIQLTGNTMISFQKNGNNKKRPMLQDQMTGSVQPLILPVLYMQAKTIKRTVCSKILIDCLERFKLLIQH